MGLREILKRPVPMSQVVSAVLVVAGLILMLPADTRRLGLLIIVVTMISATVHDRMRRRRRPARLETIQEAALLPWDCETVWNLIKPAEKSPLVDPTIHRGYQVPGTPTGLGEQQAHERHDGTVVVIEVVEYVENRWAAVRQAAPRVDNPVRTIQALQPTDDGCVYTFAAEIDLRGGQFVSPDFIATWRAGAQEQIRRIRQVLTEAAQHPGRPVVSPWPPPAPRER